MGADVEYMEARDGWLGIHYAVRWNDLKMLKLYVKAGAYIDGTTNSNETALHKCARWDRKEAAIYLLSLGANPDFKNSDGKRPSDMTADSDMKFLLDNYKQYLILEDSRRKEEKLPDKEVRTHSKTSNRLYDRSINTQLAIDFNEIMNSSPKSKTKSYISSNNIILY